MGSLVYQTVWPVNKWHYQWQSTVSPMVRTVSGETVLCFRNNEGFRVRLYGMLYKENQGDCLNTLWCFPELFSNALFLLCFVWRLVCIPGERSNPQALGYWSVSLQCTSMAASPENSLAQRLLMFNLKITAIGAAHLSVSSFTDRLCSKWTVM